MKHFIISLLVAALLSAISPTSTQAQTPGTAHINRQLRQLFLPLQRPPNPKLYLYDMSVHFMDSSLYTTSCTDTINQDIWYKLYEEMYYSAYDTTTMENVDSIFYRAHKFQKDTIPMGIMNYAFYKFKPNALSSNTYFNFDTVNNVLTDKHPRSGYPFLDSNIFAAVALVKESYFSDPVFRIDPDYFFYDKHNSDHFGKEATLKIDFGDGNGYVTFNNQKISHHKVNYTGAGIKYIHTIIESNIHKGIVASSYSALRVKNSVKLPIPTATIQSPGLNVGVFGGCNSDIKSGKVVIYLSGFDLLDMLPNTNRSVSQIYQEMISENRVVQLKNQGYSFVVVDYQNSRIDMRFNALYVMNLIEKLKCNLDMEHQFVIMGESMGGLIARYLMTYMESVEYDNQDLNPFFSDAGDVNNVGYLQANPDIYNLPQQWCLTPKKHNTRLLITLDAPHQGANVPLSYQHAYKSVMGFLSKAFGPQAKAFTRAHNLFLDGQAAQQMLIYHIDAKSGSNYYSHSDKDDFFFELQQMGDYPKYCKVTALSNGSLSGESQTNYYTSQPRMPGDAMVDLDLDIYGKVLWHKMRLFDATLLCRSNPDKFSQIYKAEVRMLMLKIELTIFGIKFDIAYRTIFNDQANADVNAYCTGPGGFSGSPNYLGYSSNTQQPNVKYDWMRYMFDYKLKNNGKGCLSLNSHLGIKNLMSAHIDFNLCTKGLHFALVPVQSALDYGTLGNHPLNQDIESESITSKLSKVKPDVIIGYPNKGILINQNHVGLGKESFRNEDIYNITQTPAPVHPYTYYSCINYNDDVQRGLINLEIGDEELYLENAELAWQSLYQAEFDIRVNERNPYFNYPSTAYSPLSISGVYSKKNAFKISNIGLATFMVDQTNSPTRIGLSYSAPFTGTYNSTNENLSICCINFIGARGDFEEKKVAQNPKESFVKLFPNPNDGKELVVNYQFSESGRVYFQVLDMLGNIMLEKDLNNEKAHLETTSVFSLKSALIPGIYMVRLYTPKEALSSTLIIKK